MDALCNQCHWQGSEEQLVPIYKPNPKEPGDVIPVPGCPACLSDQFLEYQELREPPLLSPGEVQKILNDWFLRQPEPYPAYNPDLYETLALAQWEADKKWMKEHCYLKAGV